ncbi:hypothetical protein EDB92DRAFT_1939216 [Lactarius akahatsu]|uniref:HECT-type E3 ubiquitin transferase n=1 Tax=Lactarius akahatsu TaxID=416441 RepID=A0AAD4QD85_9AGAM|nr:hypothetical protein EDB92DRAFT_1939216 [Lactarius akahatsu]
MSANPQAQRNQNLSGPTSPTVLPHRLTEQLAALPLPVADSPIWIGAPTQSVLAIRLPIPAAHAPTFPSTTNADGTNADVRSPLRCVERRTRTTTWNDLWRTFALVAVTTALANRSTLGPLPSGLEMYVLNHSTRTATTRGCRQRSMRTRRSDDPDDHSKRLMVYFEGEFVLDHGDVSREWSFFLKHTIFYPSYRFSVHDNYTLQIDLAQGEHPDYFKFIGQVLSPSSDQFLCVRFVPGFSKMVPSRETNPKDLEVVNHGLYKGLTRILALLDRSIKDRWSCPLSKTEIGTGANGGVGGLGTRYTIKSRPQVDVLQLRKRARLDTAEDIVVNSSPLL